MEKINIAELLKDCPKGMKLYSPITGECTLDLVDNNGCDDVIRVNFYGGEDEVNYTCFYKYGNYFHNGECLLFPSKGKTTWEGFHRPFKDGDIIHVCDEYSDATFNYVAIIKEIETGGKIHCYCFYNFEEDYFNTNDFLYDINNTRFATEEEKQKLFDAIKADGYKWYPDTKSLTKLPMFKDGDVITCNNSACTFISIFKDKPFEKTFRQHCSIISDNNKLLVDNNKLIVGNKYADYANPRFATEEEKQKLFDAISENGYRWNTESKTLEKLVEPKFKIEKGKWYVCIKDLLDNYANKAFCKGNIYLSTQDGSLIPSNSNVPFEVFCPTTYFRPWTIQDAKDGDVVSYDQGWTCIFKCIHGIWYSSYCFITSDGEFHTGYEEHAVDSTINGNAHLATKEEKAKLFQAIKANGYYWDTETKTLKKLVESNFKDGDIIATNLGSVFILKDSSLVDVYSCYVALNHESKFIYKEQRFGYKDLCRLATEEEKKKLFQAIKDNGYKWNPETKTLEKLPKFKVGDKIKLKGGDDFGFITQVADCFYTIKNKNQTHCWPIKKQDDWELVPNKFDISKLKPFDKVLVRDFDNETWEINFFSKLLDGKHFKCIDLSYVQCIPYEGNEHLLGTTINCYKFYRTWEI